MITTQQQVSEEVPVTLTEQFPTEMTQQFRPIKNAMNLVIPRRNILIITALGILSWVFVAGLFALFLN
ncbi:MAG: hypothetical protein WKF68_01270 [Daejeonella sp.]